MNQPFRPLTSVLTLVMFAGLSGGALARTPQHPATQGNKPHAAHEARDHQKSAHAKETKDKHARHAAAKQHEPHKKAAAESRTKEAGKAQSNKMPSDKDQASEAPPKEQTPPLTGDLAVLKNVFDLTRQGKTTDATATAKTIGDPAARRLAEWFVLRHADSQAGFARYAAFIADNPEWPGVGLMRRRAEARLWQERADPATVHAFTGDRPVSAKGRFALARTLLAQGDHDGAARLVRDAWRSEELTERTETDVIEAFRDLLSGEDYRARMDKRIGAKEFGAAMRAAHHLDDDALATVKACAAVKGDETKAPDLLNDVSAEGRADLAYVLCRIQYLMRKDKIDDAARLVLAAPAATMAQQDTDEWWRVRRVLARKLLDQRDFTAAYQVVRKAATPDKEAYRAEFHFLPGWIALRYLHDPKAAAAHFAHIDDGCANPITLARA
ncbi:MAG: lytic transglycosylase domain-containing protein, partial [Bradyrhizobium sp.]|nr:lytic transglycosylase domain-containing protein [Bradyrhizobium sp.]